jgi:hypothetical protein
MSQQAPDCQCHCYQPWPLHCCEYAEERASLHSLHRQAHLRSSTATSTEFICKSWNQIRGPEVCGGQSSVKHKTHVRLPMQINHRSSQTVNVCSSVTGLKQADKLIAVLGYILRKRFLTSVSLGSELSFKIGNIVHYHHDVGVLGK